jgi:hypothetical protein
MSRELSLGTARPAGGIMLAPQAAAVPVLMLSPDHVGSAVPVLAVLLLLDRAPPRWWVPTLAGIVLTWALVSDKVLMVTAVLPLLVICGGRGCYSVARRQPLRSRWLELSLIGVTVAAVGLSRGFSPSSPPTADSQSGRSGPGWCRGLRW